MRISFGAFLLLILALAPTHLAAQQSAAETAQAALVTAEALAALTPEERTELLSRLSDEQARALLSEYLRTGAGSAADEGDSAIEMLEEHSERFRRNFAAALNALPQLSRVPVFVYERLSEGRDAWHPLRVVIYLVFTLAVALGIERLSMRLLNTVRVRLTAEPGADFLGRLGRAGGLLLVDLVGLAVFAAVALLEFFIVYEEHEPTRLFVLTVIAAVLLFRIVLAISRMLFLPTAGASRVVPLDDATARIAYRYTATVAAIGTFGFLGCDLMRLFGLSEDPHRLLLLGVGTLLFGVLMVGIWRVRSGVAAVLRGDASEATSGGLRPTLSGLWYLPVILYIAIIYVLAVFNGFSGKVTGAVTGVSSLLLIAVLPLADRILCGIIDRVFGATNNAMRSSLQVFHRAAHIFIGVIAVVALAAIWRADVFSFDEASIGGRMARAALDIALTVFVGYLAWGVLKVVVMRHLPAEAEEHAQPGGSEGGGTGTSRLATVLPLFMRMAQISIIVMVVMVILSALGVNIGPLLAGAGVVGIAIGFGAQTLVRDLVSGLFFLIDDAFRRGEYVDLGGIKGTVERINVRSLALRHHLGMLHTVPYGEIQHLTNFSRDWVIMKLEFRVSYDTDPDKVKKIFKQIGKEMLEHPEFGKNFIEPFKSQGVKAMEESAMIVRGKFMARPGTQFQIRKELYNRVQKAFQENGIEFAHRRVMVDLPPDLNLPAEKKKEIAEAAAAGAALAD